MSFAIWAILGLKTFRSYGAGSFESPWCYKHLAPTEPKQLTRLGDDALPHPRATAPLTYDPLATASGSVTLHNSSLTLISRGT